ncbi:LIM domain only protein 7-like isoform X4 [Gadus macrocephalus]|uniref:LIM domain only protein 7-like isoform X4 n=1 Tax=Gadus macrocephalus TaxID=80720 RepID=UPI0028CB7D85|nr:LIM domain only protein 7-like isoform X4 [Gadus macrocephalus]
MEWREQTSVSCMDAFEEAKRWIEKVTSKSFESSNFRAALENGVLLCDLMNKLKPGIIKRLNRLSTPIAGLDNVNVFLKACSKLGLNESQLFHPGDLQDLSTRVTLRSEESNRRLKNVLITVYWLGRRAQLEPFYCGPQLNFKAFEGLLGLTLSKALEEGSGLCPRDGGYGDPEKENLYHVRPAYRRDDSVEGGNYLDHRSAHQRSEGCGSDVEADQLFSMSAQKDSAQQQERGYVPPVEGAYPLPREGGCVAPAPLRRKKGCEENKQGLLTRVSQIQLRPGRPPQVNPGWIWSKSTTDIPMESPGYQDDGQNLGGPDVSRPSRPPNGARSKESVEKWQEDLTKWKNRRRSTNSDLHRKVEERNHEVNETTRGTRATVGQNKMANGDQLSPSVPGPASSHSSRASRPALSRSYTVETLLGDPWPNKASSCSPVQNQPLSGAMPASHRPLLGEEVPSASLASDGNASSTATTPSTCSPYTSQTLIKLQPSPTAGQTQTGGRGRRTTMGPVPYLGIGTVDRTPYSPQVTDRKITILHHGPFLQRRDATQQNHYSLNTAGPGAGEEAGGLVNGPTHHSFLHRYNSMPWSGSASLPRGYRRSEGSARLSNVLTARPFGTRPSRKSSLLSTGSDYKTLPLSGDMQAPQPILNRQVATSLIRAPRQATEKQEVENQAEKERDREEGGHTNGLPYCSQPPFKTLSQTHLPPPAIHAAPQKRMRVSLSLTPNSVDDFGFQTDWSATGARVTSVQQGSPAELCQLCVGDVITTLGGAKVEQLSSSQWESTMTSALQSGSLTMDVSRYSNQGCPENHVHKDIMTLPTGPDLPAQGLGIQTRNGEFEGTRKTASSKELERIVLRNKRRRAEFFDVKGGTESAISDLQVPSLKPSSSNWSWDHEEERKRQERWQEEQERHLQERYQRDQKRMQAEWQSAREGTGEEPRGTDERPVWLDDPGVVIPTSLTRPVVQRQAPHWEADGSVRHQNKGTGSAGVQYSDPAPVGPPTPTDLAGFRPLGTEAGSKPRSLEAEKDKRAEPDFGMSKSTPTLASDHRQTKGPGEQKKGKVATASKEEQNRQQILEEMKKRTQLLTDNSWIRQRRASSLKEPLYTGGTLRRYESLDSLHTAPPSEPPCELSGPRSLSGSSGRSVYPRYTTCPTPPDQLPSCPVALSQHSFPDASCIPGKAAGDCAVPSISEERDQKFRAETTSLSASVATSSSISSN